MRVSTLQNANLKSWRQKLIKSYFHFRTIIGNVIGLHWMVLGLKSIPISILLFIAAYFLPESPRYLFDIGENGRGSDALKWFRTTSDPESVEMEIKEVFFLMIPAYHDRIIS